MREKQRWLDKKGCLRGDQMGAIKYAEMKKNRSLGDFFITDHEEDLDYEN